MSERRAWVRPALAVAGVLAGLNLMLVAFAELVPGPSGPGGSSYATSSHGLAAWAELLDEYGYDVGRLRKRPDRTTLDPGSTLVVADPDALTRGEADALLGFVERGGRLIALAGGEPGWIDRLVPAAPSWREDAPKEWSASPLGAGGARDVVSDGRGAWTAGYSTPALVRAGSDGLVVKRRRARGTVFLVADASPFENRLLARADNAALALAVAGPRSRPVRFAEAFHGYGEARGLGALPSRWQLALIGLGVAAAVAMLAAARRIGPADSEPAEYPPPRRQFVDAVGLALERTGEPAQALEPVRRELEARLETRFGLRQASDDELERAAGELGLDDEAARAVAGRSHDVLALGRALAELSQGERYGHRVARG